MSRITGTLSPITTVNNTSDVIKSGNRIYGNLNTLSTEDSKSSIIKTGNRIYGNLNIPNVSPDITVLSFTQHPVDIAIYVDSENTVYILTYDYNVNPFPVDPIMYYTIIGNTITQCMFEDLFGRDYIAIALADDNMIYGYVRNINMFLDYVFLLNKYPVPHLSYRYHSPYPERKRDCRSPYSYGGFEYSIYLTYPEPWITNVNFYKKKNGVTISSVIKSIDYRDYPQQFPNKEWAYYIPSSHFIPKKETIHMVLCNIYGFNCTLYVKMKMS